MKYDPEKHHRRSIRLRGFDYATAGAYFVTLCSFDRACLFGQVVEGVVRLSSAGQIVQEEWLASAELRTEIALGEFLVMPNHLHGIVHILATQNGPPMLCRGAWPQPRSIGALVAGFKSSCTKRINEQRNHPGSPVWQRNYYEHIIRDAADYERIAEYIAINPLRWDTDTLHPPQT
jgi:REP element-mobilizing transposase RayT